MPERAFHQRFPADDWSVDDRCINCNLARQHAPGMIGFDRDHGPYGGKSVILRQPETDEEVRNLYRAAHACPTRSVHPPGDEWAVDGDPYPQPLDEDGTVLLCGHTSLRTFGAMSYLCRRPDGTAMMIDTPKFRPVLPNRFQQAVGTITDVLLTHVDHVAHGRQWADALDAVDPRRRPGVAAGRRPRDPRLGPGGDRTRRGRAPVPRPQPGTTLFIADERCCFAGDALFWSESYRRIDLADTVVYDSVRTWARSVAKGAEELTFEWVLPGHGPYHRLPAAEMRARLRALARRAVHFEEPERDDYGAEVRAGAGVHGRHRHRQRGGAAA
ncbi:ferredoxin, partial [Saccharopolyspora sp. NPDC047091]|uniref:4Fe-4S domain-containing protein n=1 Tax=Saccharopolyspora sp. NPDC047091 TaxID=3155924 RepID=UPI00340ABEE4